MSWIDFFATPAKPGGTIGCSSVRDKKLRQLQDALGRLADPTVQLVTLPQLRKATGKYERFLLMNEGGTPYEGGPNDRYTIPADQGQKLLRLPAGLFLNGWIHVLEDSEIAFILMIAYLHALFGEKPVFAAGEIRLLQFGVGRETYQAHHMLSRFNLIDVERDPSRDLFGSRVEGFTEDNPPKLHRFQLLRAGFEEPAVHVMRSSIERRLGNRNIQ